LPEELCYGKCRGDACLAEGVVSLIIYFVVFMIVGDFAAYLLGLITEYEWGPEREPNRLSFSLFSFLVAVLGAC
jgi:hypothetical protein